VNRSIPLPRWFRRTHGITVGEFVRRAHSHFTRTFRNARHVSPSEFRRRRL
jgi:AraC-like DNA-binding protein